MQAVEYVEPSRGKELQEMLKKAEEINPNQKSYFEKESKFFLGKRRMYLGELPELNLYKSLKKYFEDRNESIVVFFGHDVLKFDMTADTNNKAEKDCILLNLTKNYVMMIEVKKSFGKGDSVNKAMLQITNGKVDFESWFSTEIDSCWKFIPMVYCHLLESDVPICSSCKPFIIEGNCIIQ